MKIIPIFGKNFKSIQFAGEDQDKFHEIFNQWNDPVYLEEFFEKNQRDISDLNYDIESAITKTLREAEELENKFTSLKSKYSRDDNVYELFELFEPLHARESSAILTPSKVKFNWLRIYAIRLDNEVYIVTGGAIKLTRTMQDRKHTYAELRIINSCIDNLKRVGVIDKETIIEEVEF